MDKEQHNDTVVKIADFRFAIDPVVTARLDMDRADYLVVALVYAALGALSSRMGTFWLCSVVQIRTATVHER